MFRYCHNILLDARDNVRKQRDAKNRIFSTHVLEISSVVLDARDVHTGALLDVGPLVVKLNAHRSPEEKRERGVESCGDGEGGRKLSGRAGTHAVAEALRSVVPTERLAAADVRAATVPGISINGAKTSHHGDLLTEVEGLARGRRVARRVPRGSREGER